MRRAAVITLATGLTLAAPAGGAGGFDLSTFRTPSGNIGCQYSRGVDHPSFLRCDVLSGIKPLPRKPAGCQLDWGTAIGMNKTGTSRLMCVGDTAYDPRARVLAYGTTWKRDGFTCVSKSTGLRCTNRSAHGFSLSRQRSTRF